MSFDALFQQDARNPLRDFNPVFNADGSVTLVVDNLAQMQQVAKEVGTRLGDTQRPGDRPVFINFDAKPLTGKSTFIKAMLISCYPDIGAALEKMDTRHEIFRLKDLKLLAFDWVAKFPAKKAMQAANLVITEHGSEINQRYGTPEERMGKPHLNLELARIKGEPDISERRVITLRRDSFKPPAQNAASF